MKYDKWGYVKQDWKSIEMKTILWNSKQSTPIVGEIFSFRAKIFIIYCLIFLLTFHATWYFNQPDQIERFTNKVQTKKPAPVMRSRRFFASDLKRISRSKSGYSRVPNKRLDKYFSFWKKVEKESFYITARNLLQSVSAKLSPP